MSYNIQYREKDLSLCPFGREEESTANAPIYSSWPSVPERPEPPACVPDIVFPRQQIMKRNDIRRGRLRASERTRKSTPIVALASSSRNHCLSEKRNNRLLFPTDELPMRRKLTLMCSCDQDCGAGILFSRGRKQRGHKLRPIACVRDEHLVLSRLERN